MSKTKGQFLKKYANTCNNISKFSQDFGKPLQYICQWPQTPLFMLSNKLNSSMEKYYQGNSEFFINC